MLMFFYIEGVIITFERYTYTESKYEKTTDKVFSDIKKNNDKEARCKIKKHNS